MRTRSKKVAKVETKWEDLRSDLRCAATLRYGLECAGVKPAVVEEKVRLLELSESHNVIREHKKSRRHVRG